MAIHKVLVLLAHAFVGWALCAATMNMGMAVTTLDNALVIHAIAAPVFFTVISLIYFRKFHYTTPLQTAFFFLAFVMAMDFFLVAMLINKSFAMFSSFLGTWLPFALIFMSTYLTGISMTGSKEKTARQKRWMNWLLGSFYALVVLMSLLGYLAATGALPVPA